MKIDLTGVQSSFWHTAPSMEIYPGVVKRELWADANGANGANGAKALMLEFGPGAAFTETDEHFPGPEEVFVVSGVFNDGVTDYPAGSFIHSPKGSAHIPQSKDGCVLFVFFPEG